MQLSGVHGESRAKRASESTHQPRGHPATMALVSDTFLGLGESPHVHFVPTMRVVTFLTKLMPKGINLSTVRQLVNRGVEMGNHKPWPPGSWAQREQGQRKHSGAGEPQDSPFIFSTGGAQSSWCWAQGACLRLRQVWESELLIKARAVRFQKQTGPPQWSSSELPSCT